MFVFFLSSVWIVKLLFHSHFDYHIEFLFSHIHTFLSLSLQVSQSKAKFSDKHTTKMMNFILKSNTHTRVICKKKQSTEKKHKRNNIKFSKRYKVYYIHILLIQRISSSTFIQFIYFFFDFLIFLFSCLIIRLKFTSSRLRKLEENMTQYYYYYDYNIIYITNIFERFVAMNLCFYVQCFSNFSL